MSRGEEVHKGLWHSGTAEPLQAVLLLHLLHLLLHRTQRPHSSRKSEVSALKEEGGTPKEEKEKKKSHQVK